MFDKLAEDIENRYWQKLAAIEKEAASNLRSDLVLGRLSDAAKESLMSTPRYSKNSPSQILADIKSMLRGKGSDVGALTSELIRRGIPYRVRGKGLSPKDVELDLSKGHAILNTPYLPSNYSESFINNNVNRRFKKVVDATSKAGFEGVKVYPDYTYPRVEKLNLSPRISNSYRSMNMHIPAEQLNSNNSQLEFDRKNASTILHEINEANRILQNFSQYNKIIKNDQNSPLYTSGENPGVIQSPSNTSIEMYGRPADPANLFNNDKIHSYSDIGPYSDAGFNNHESATILMNELMDQNAAHVGIKPEPGTLDDIFSFRKQGPDNPVNRMTGIDLTSREQPFVPRNIVKNKKEYLKRIREVRKAEDALQKEYLTRNSFDRGGHDSEDSRFNALDLINTSTEDIYWDMYDYLRPIYPRRQRKQYNDFLVNYLRSRGFPVE